jgi:hypothetical protein
MLKTHDISALRRLLAEQGMVAGLRFPRRPIIICLSLGLISTVAMAWAGLGVAREHLYENNTASFVGLTAGSLPCICREYRPTLAATLRETYFSDQIIINGDEATLRYETGPGQYPVRQAWRARIPPQPRLEIHEFSGGFPLRCLWEASLDLHLSDSENHSEYTPLGYSRSIALWHASGYSLIDNDRRLNMPVGPIWSGLIVDFGFYALCWYGLLFLRGACRRAHRRRRNHCIICNYDRAGLDPSAMCPECGSSDHSRK